MTRRPRLRQAGGQVIGLRTGTDSATATCVAHDPSVMTPQADHPHLQHSTHCPYGQSNLERLHSTQPRSRNGQQTRRHRGSWEPRWRLHPDDGIGHVAGHTLSQAHAQPRGARVRLRAHHLWHSVASTASLFRWYFSLAELSKLLWSAMAVGRAVTATVTAVPSGPTPPLV